MDLYWFKICTLKKSTDKSSSDMYAGNQTLTLDLEWWILRQSYSKNSITIKYEM